MIKLYHNTDRHGFFVKKADMMTEYVSVGLLCVQSHIFKELSSLCVGYRSEFTPPIFKADKFKTEETQRLIREMWNLFMRNY